MIQYIAGVGSEKCEDIAERTRDVRDDLPPDQRIQEHYCALIDSTLEKVDGSIGEVLGGGAALPLSLYDDLKYRKATVEAAPYFSAGGIDLKTGKDATVSMLARPGGEFIYGICTQASMRERWKISDRTGLIIAKSGFGNTYPILTFRIVIVTWSEHPTSSLESTLENNRKAESRMDSPGARIYTLRSEADVRSLYRDLDVTWP